jgi:TATA-binding protein-associated factor Taf7
MGITLGSLRRPLARRSLKAQLNQIRTWVRQGRTDAWIAHQLEVSVGDIRAFKREHELAPADAAGDGDGEPLGAGADREEQDLRAEDDALVAAALEAELQAEEEEDEEDEEEADEDEDEDRPRRRRRGRRGGRGRRRRPKGLEGTFDHGEEGYGLWLDPAVQYHPVYF